MEALNQVTKALDEAQIELAGAEIGLAEATARAEAAREGTARLKAAVAALSGETPVEPASPATDWEPMEPYEEARPIPTPTPGREATATMSQEEFNAQRKKKQRKREKELQAANPYGNIKCSGCGEVGKLNEQIVQAPSGVPIRMLNCSGCGNQNII
jgi:hypothetical protein